MSASRPEGSVKVRMTPEVMETMVVRDHLGRSLTWAWGEPDEEGCYTPTITVALDDPAAQDMADGRALRLLREASPLGSYLVIESDTDGWSVSVRDGLLDILVASACDKTTIEAAADACREDIEARR